MVGRIHGFVPDSKGGKGMSHSLVGLTGDDLEMSRENEVKMWEGIEGKRGE